jgi:hypothetical protein
MFCGTAAMFDAEDQCNGQADDEAGHRNADHSDYLWRYVLPMLPR